MSKTDKLDREEKKSQGKLNSVKRAAIVPYLLALADRYDIRKITEYQYRVNNILDIYPTSRKFHNLRTRKRGYITCSLERFLRENL